jgi:hypothetical protein
VVRELVIEALTEEQLDVLTEGFAGIHRRIVERKIQPADGFAADFDRCAVEGAQTRSLSRRCRPYAVTTTSSARP